MTLLKRLLIAALCLVPLTGVASAQSAKVKSTLQTEVTTSFPDNTTGAITPLTMRTVLGDFVASWQQWTGVNAQVGTTYTLLGSDYGQLVTFNNGSAVSAILPAPNGTNYPFNAYLLNSGAGLVTVTVTNGGTINGLASIPLATGQGIHVVADVSQVNFQGYFFTSSSAADVGTSGYAMTGTGASTLATFQGFTLPSTGSFTSVRGWQDKATDLCSIIDYGADKTGVANSATALGNVSTDQVTCHIPKGTYTLTSAPTGAGKAQTFVSDSTITWTGGSATTRFGANVTQTTNGITALGSSTIVMNSVTGVVVGMIISDDLTTGIASGSTVTAINGNTLTMSAVTIGSIPNGKTIFFAWNNIFIRTGQRQLEIDALQDPSWFSNFNVGFGPGSQTALLVQASNNVAYKVADSPNIVLVRVKDSGDHYVSNGFGPANINTPSNTNAIFTVISKGGNGGIQALGVSGTLTTAGAANTETGISGNAAEAYGAILANDASTPSLNGALRFAEGHMTDNGTDTSMSGVSMAFNRTANYPVNYSDAYYALCSGASAAVAATDCSSVMTVNFQPTAQPFWFGIDSRRTTFRSASWATAAPSQCVSTWVPSATFTGSIAANTLTVTAVSSGTIVLNDYIELSVNNTIKIGSRITAFGTGTGGTGTYTVSINAVTGGTTVQTVGSSTISSYQNVPSFCGGTTGSAVLQGIAAGGGAASGKIGEIISANTNVASRVNITPSATTINVISGGNTDFTPGDWDISGQVCFLGSATFVPSLLAGGINTTTATLPTAGGVLTSGYVAQAFNSATALAATPSQCYTIPAFVANITVTTSYYLVAQATFSAGTVSAYGTIRGRRMR